MYKVCIITFSEPELYKIKIFIKYYIDISGLLVNSKSFSQYKRLRAEESNFISYFSGFSAEESILFNILNSFDIYDRTPDNCIHSFRKMFIEN